MRGDRIADLRSPDGALISVYASRPGPGGFSALLSELVKPLRERASQLPRSVEKSVVSDTERIRALAERLEFDSAPAYAVFASSTQGIFELEPLGGEVSNVATMGPRPYMRPLRAMPRALRSGVLVADNSTVRTFVAVSGHIEEIGQPLSSGVENRSWGGFGGYDEHGVRLKAMEATVRMWKTAGERLLERHLGISFDYLATGSRPELVDEIGATLHPYLARLPQISFVASPQGVNDSRLRAELALSDDVVRRQRHEAAAGRVCDTAWSGGNAVLGLGNVIAAANAHAVESLVVAGPFSRPGVLCENCGHIGRLGETCPLCDSAMFAVDDVVSAVMDSVVAAGGTVSQVGVASTLDREGVGALTRFPVSV